MRAVNKNTSKIIGIVMMIMEGLFIVFGTLLVIVMSVVAGLKKFNFVPSQAMTAVFASAFAAAAVMIVFVALMVIISGVLVIKTIRQTSRNVLQAVKSQQLKETDLLSADSSKLRTSIDKASFERRVQSPFKITFGLLIGLIICVILELIAIAVASIAADVEEVKLIWQALNCAAVLIFGVLIIFLFYPLFMDTENALNEIEKRKEGAERKKQMAASIDDGRSVTSSGETTELAQTNPLNETPSSQCVSV
ncbi:predicted protein [Naegleria gruberi]|uniref:Predicted protein n=1 Tax=Naegleria gruberi TaxID=5762 RepID=D2VGR2_NAEGR|nr:uncharacterized protein NAEGRDRAFT_68067 [Naegleria gruberi]EFC44106.1 predicted protein [Naegleria gruberi]|eukprot:XP_002676850.1 predicted protein [Naegleria gruberi strain NEG-M]